MRSPTTRPIRYVQPRHSQARRRYPLRDLKPMPIRRWTIDWHRDPANLLGGVVLVVAAVYLWSVLPL
jgi:hypothetical protein